MKRGRKPTEAKAPCPRCGTLYNPNGMPSHLRACNLRRRIEDAAQELADSLLAEPQAGPSLPLAAAAPVASGSQDEDVPPPPPVEEPHAHATMGAVVHDIPANPPIDDDHRQRRSVSVEDVPDVESLSAAPANTAPLEAVFVDPVQAPGAPDPMTLRLPSFEPPILHNAPADLYEDDFLTVHHPHARKSPEIARFEDYKPNPPSEPLDPARLNLTPWDPFTSRIDYEFAAFTTKVGLNQEQVGGLLELVQHIMAKPSAFSFKSYNDVKRAWEVAADVSTNYKPHDFTVKYKETMREYTTLCRPLFKWGMSLVRDPVLAPKFNWHASRKYKRSSEGVWMRVVDNPSTADGWWDAESEIPEDGDALVYSLYADKTRLSSFGGQKGYPIMARIDNLASDIRGSDQYGGAEVVGFLPIVEDEEEEGKPGFTTHKRVVWHKAFEFLLADLAPYAKTGYRVKCGDGVIRTLYPVILMLIADYEEQTMMALTRGMRGLCPCPVCLVPQAEQAVLGVHPLWPLRDQKVAQELVAQKDDPTVTVTALNDLLKPLGLRPVENVFWKVLTCNVYRALSWDRLHAYHGGLFSDHLFAQFQWVVRELLGRAAVQEINAQFNATPPWPDLNHFKAVVAVNFTDGTKYEDISKVVLVQASYAVMQRYRSARGLLLLQCIRRYMVLDILAGLEVQTQDTLQMYATELTRFSTAIQAYAAKYDDKNWSFPKLHTHQHLIDDIVSKGASRNFNTKPFEHMHGPLKTIYQGQTNFKDTDIQVSQIEHRLSVCKTLDARIDALDQLMTSQVPSPPETDEIQPFRFHHIYLGARQPLCSLAQLEAQHPPEVDSDYSRFRIRLQHYLNSLQTAAPGVVYQTLKPEDEIMESRFIKVDYESVVSWRLETDNLRCNPRFQNTPRYDFVIYQADEQTIGFAQLKLVFLVTFQDIQYPIAFVKPFNIIHARRNMDRELGLCRLRPTSGPESSMFIPAQSILRGALIIKDGEGDGARASNYVVIDTLDGDMFLRLRRAVPEWNT